MSILNLVRSNILKLKPYQSARSLKETGNIWLNANEYPIAPNYILFPNRKINRYPLCQPKKVINNYAAYVNLQANQVLACRGADEGIELLIRVFCNPGVDSVLYCPPTYGMYSVSAESFGVERRIVNMKENWQLDLIAIKKQLDNVKLIYICSPNNPTGNIINSNDIHTLLQITNNRAILVIDEAYIDFYPEGSVVHWIKKYEHLVILRTLSKAFALAGLRCGFVLANKEVIDFLLKVITPYPLALPVSKIAEQALSVKGLKETIQRVKNININREILLYELKKCLCVKEIYPSVCNYLLVRFNSDYKVFKSLYKRGIVLRDQSKQFMLDNCLRITVGTKIECQNVVLVLKTLNIISSI